MLAFEFLYGALPFCVLGLWFMLYYSRRAKQKRLPLYYGRCLPWFCNCSHLKFKCNY